MSFVQISSDLLVPARLRMPLLTDGIGLPRYWATVWYTINENDHAESTCKKKLGFINALYSFSDELFGEDFLDDALGAMRTDDLIGLLESYFIALKNRSSRTPETNHQWQTGLSFIKDTVLRLSKNGIAFDKFSEVELKFRRIEALYGQLQIAKSNKPDILRSLPALVVSHLYDELDPESLTNPFSRIGTRWAVFQAFILMLHQGLRIGEVLLLPVDTLKSGFDDGNQRRRFWINIQKNENHAKDDPRYNSPSIKTPDSIRQVPVSELTANLIKTYVENYRGKPNHPFLLNSQWNTPLSHESITKYFAKISRKLPPSILRILYDRTGKVSITPHDLRHTSSVVRLNQLLEANTPFEVALQQLRTFFGWSRTSDMPRRYARAVFEDRLSNVWSKVLDDRVEVLKSIPRGH